MEVIEKNTEEIIEGLREKVSIVDDSNTLNNGTSEIVSYIKTYVSRKTLVPVICEDMYEYKDPVSNKRQSLHSYIIEKIIEKYYNSNVQIDVTEEELFCIVNEGYYGISLLQSKLRKDLYADIFKLIMDEDNNVYDCICVKEEVLSFLLACDLPLIITTSCFPILEKELKGQYESYWNKTATKNDKDLSGKWIYHIFGEAELEDSNWGYNDRHVLQFLKSSLSDAYALTNLTAIIANNNSRKTLLFLGNDCPDWLFRFILTPIYGGDVYDDGKGYYMSVNCRNEECSLNHFLRDIKFERESELISVLQDVTTKINNAKHSNPAIYHGKKYDFFVAHASDDREGAEKLVSRMRKEGLDVWVDYENIKDGHYWQRIIDAMKESAYFMPYVTEMYISKNKEAKKVNNAFNELGINSISIDMAECVRLESYLDGVQIELLLADKWYEINKRKLYSIPVLQKGSMFYDEEITTKRIKNWSYESKRLPQNLFWGIQMNEFDEKCPQSFMLDWEKYKKI